jgi:hypothetical protein
MATVLSRGANIGYDSPAKTPERARERKFPGSDLNIYQCPRETVMPLKEIQDTCIIESNVRQSMTCGEMG